MGAQEVWLAQLRAAVSSVIGEFTNATLTVTPRVRAVTGEGFLDAQTVTNTLGTAEEFAVVLDWTGGAPRLLTQDVGQTWQFDGTLVVSAMGTDYTAAGLAAYLGQWVATGDEDSLADCVVTEMGESSGISVMIGRVVPVALSQSVVVGLTRRG